MDADRPEMPAQAAPPFFATGKRPRDLARELGLSEAELVAGHDGPEVTRLVPDMSALIEALPSLGEIMCLTRNEVAVHEKIGCFGGISVSGRTGLVINPPLDLRLFLQHWAYAFAVVIPDEKGVRRSLQVYDHFGDAVVKIHLRPASDVVAFEALRLRFAHDGARPLVVETPVPPAGTGAPEPIDAEAFRAEFAAMGDVHEFFGILKRHGLDRRSSLDLMGADHVRPLGEKPVTRLLEAAAASGVPIMCFVGNRGSIQIHTGAVTDIRAMGPWINAMEPDFTLHLREDLVASAFVVRKPTKFGLLTSVEIYDETADLVAQFFGVRDPESPEDDRWRSLVDRL